MCWPCRVRTSSNAMGPAAAAVCRSWCPDLPVVVEVLNVIVEVVAAVVVLWRHGARRACRLRTAQRQPRGHQRAPVERRSSYDARQRASEAAPAGRYRSRSLAAGRFERNAPGATLVRAPTDQRDQSDYSDQQSRSDRDSQAEYCRDRGGPEQADDRPSTTRRTGDGTEPQKARSFPSVHPPIVPHGGAVIGCSSVVLRSS